MKEENETYIKCLNMFGRIPKQWELLKEIERLNNIINELEKWLKEKQILYGINQQGFSWVVCGEALDKGEKYEEKE